jgi:ferrous iron transport protein A
MVRRKPDIDNRSRKRDPIVRQLSEFAMPVVGGAAETAPAVPLSSGRRGFAGTIVEVCAPEISGALDGAEIQRRLLEMGFVEGAAVEIAHEGLVGRDPIAVRLTDRTVALRRREARAVLVRPTAKP